MKTRLSGKILREKRIMVKAFCTPAGWDTTSEPQGRNALPGAPVKAFGQLEKSLSFRSVCDRKSIFQADPMSDGFGRNQGGTVEYICIPPLIRSGVGFFVPIPKQI